MPFSVAGAYTLPVSYQATPITPILSVQQHNTPMEDIQAALNLTMLRDARVPFTNPVVAPNAVNPNQLTTKSQVEALIDAEGTVVGRAILNAADKVAAGAQIQTRVAGYFYGLPGDVAIAVDANYLRHRPIDLVVDAGCVTGLGVSAGVSAENKLKIYYAQQRAIALGVPWTAPPDSIIESNGGLTLDSYTNFEGKRVTLRLANNRNETFLQINGADRNNRITGGRLYGLTIDGNAQNQTAAFYALAMWNFSDWHLDDIIIKDFWATAANINDRDQEGTYAWTSGGGVPYLLEAPPYGGQTSDELRLGTIKCLRSAANLTYAVTHPSMWQGDQFIIGKVYGLRGYAPRVSDSGQNGFGLQLCDDVNLRDGEAAYAARAGYLETCTNAKVHFSKILGHRSLNNDNSNLGDTYGFWISDYTQSIAGGTPASVPYAGCKNVTVEIDSIHDVSRPQTGGSYRAVCVSGGGGAGLGATDLNVKVGRIANIGATNGQAIGMSIMGQISRSKISAEIASACDIALQIDENYTTNNGGGAANTLTDVDIRAPNAAGCGYAVKRGGGAGAHVRSRIVLGKHGGASVQIPDSVERVMMGA